MKPEFRYHPVTFIPVTLIMDNALKDNGKRHFHLQTGSIS